MPSIDQADLGNGGQPAQLRACFHDAAACRTAATTFGQEHRAHLRPAQDRGGARRIRASFVKARRRRPPSPSSARASPTARCPATSWPRHSGDQRLFAFERGYYTSYSGSKAQITAPRTVAAKHIYSDGTISFLWAAIPGKASSTPT